LQRSQSFNDADDCA